MLPSQAKLLTKHNMQIQGVLRGPVGHGKSMDGVRYPGAPLCPARLRPEARHNSLHSLGALKRARREVPSGTSFLPLHVHRHSHSHP